MKEISVNDLNINPINAFNNDWALLCSGDNSKWNGMTISWGGIGELWNKNVIFTFVRPQHYTKEFLDKNDYFSISFFDEQYKSSLVICGKNSGKDYDKMSDAGLTRKNDDTGCVYPVESDLVIICKKICVQLIDPSGFIDNTIDNNYPSKDYHYVYIGEIIKILKK